MTDQVDFENEWDCPTHDELVEDWITGPECCRNCGYFAYGYKFGKRVPELTEPDDETNGNCRLNPPSFLATGGHQFGYMQPETPGSGWCGRYERGEPRVLTKRKAR